MLSIEATPFVGRPSHAPTGTSVGIPRIVLVTGARKAVCAPRVGVEWIDPPDSLLLNELSRRD